MKYHQLRLEAKLYNGNIIYTDIVFDDHCNVIVTDSNTQGKSSIINALIVGLGFDEITKSNVTALVKDTIKHEGEEHRILAAYVYLEIQNEKGDHLSVKREINPDLSKAMHVKRGTLSDWSDENCEEYFLGPNSYASARGFHNVLCEFIGFPEINVISQDDGVKRLYLQFIFSAIFIEQKRGWGDIMANSPYYGIREPKKSTVSEILGMDYIRNNLRKNKLKLELDQIRLTYEVSFNALRQHVNGLHFSLKGVYFDINETFWKPRVLRSLQGQKDLLLSDLIATKEHSLETVEHPSHGKEPSREIQDKLSELANVITSTVTRKDQLTREISILDGAIKRYQQRGETLQNDLLHNKEELKIRELFGRDDWSVQSQCPVCEHHIDETLLSQLKSFPTMSINENIKYIDDQKKMLDNIIEVELEKKQTAELEAGQLASHLEKLMAEHSGIQKSLSGTIPSELMAQAREIAQLEHELKSLKELEELTLNEFEKLKVLHVAFHEKSTTYAELKPDLSKSDTRILRKFSLAFQGYLENLGFSSFEAGAVRIDPGSFMPRVIIGEGKSRKNIRVDFGSSASDWVRIITAYTLSLHSCRSNSERSNHPNVSIFDEPAQQNISTKDHLKFYDIVADVAKNGGQVIIAETDEDHSVRAKAEALGMKVFDFKENYIL